MLNRTYLVTAGPTHEKIDPVRFIGNYSSGKMGFAIARQLAFMGATVYLVTGPVHLPTPHPAIHRIDVNTALEMQEICLKLFNRCNGAIMVAAVADYAPVKTAEQKIKHSKENLILELRPNPDIAASLGQLKRPDQILAGFALETDQEEQNAIGKLKKKNLDFIVLNSLRDEGSGFQHDTNKIKIIDHQGKVTAFELKPKNDVARDIVDIIVDLQDQLPNLV